MNKDDQINILTTRASREKNARKKAEELLEDKSRELYVSNCQLKKINEELESIVSKRTESLNQALQRAKRANQAKTDFIANISHDLRTPLNSVIGLSEILLERNLADDVKESVTTIYNSGLSLFHIVNQLLDLAQIEAGKLVLKSEPFNLIEVIRRCVDINRVITNKKNIHLNFNNDLKSLYLIGDDGRISEIINNLVGNAIKFTALGGIDVFLDIIDKNQTTCKFKITVQDTGTGISEKMQHNVFERFSRLQHDCEISEVGIGLGLSICKKFIDLMSGEISFATEINKGTSFWFIIALPISQKSAIKDTKAKKIPKLKGNILLVDDSPTNLNVVKLMLKPTGCNILTTTSGTEALTIVKDQVIDVILMDIQMPVMNGYQVTEKIQSMQDIAQPIIIAMTANAMHSDRKKCTEAGMHDYITKPIDRFKLADILKNYLETQS